MATYTMEDHNAAVGDLARQVAQFYRSEIPFRINHGSTNSTRPRDPSTPQLNIAHLNKVLNIDEENCTALVEPNVPLDSLVKETLKVGLMPLVVMEFPGITVGGGFSGASGESTGWKEGLFDCGIQEVEMILGNGERVLAVKGGENGELFDAARCSLGTLGVVTLLKVTLRKAEDAVQLTYKHTTSVSDTIDELTRLCNEEDSELDFIEGLLFHREHGVIITGKLVRSTSRTLDSLPRQRFDRAIDPWFYMHARETTPSHTEIVPIQSYLFRHDRGTFWCGEVFLNYCRLPNSRFWRWLLNPMMTARAMYQAMIALNAADGAIIQDLLIPLETSEQFVDYVATELKIWPLWICPIRKASEGHVWGWPFYKEKKDVKRAFPAQSTNPNGGELTLNFGVWGPTDPHPTAARRVNRGIEQALRATRGMKVPYAANYYTEDEFWQLYDREEYTALRKKWHAENLPIMYEKTRRKHTAEVEAQLAEQYTVKGKILNIWPMAGLYRVYHALFW